MTEPTGNVRPPNDYEQRMRQMEDRIRALEQRGATRLGRMSVVDPDGNEAFYSGPDPNGDLRPDGQVQWITKLRRDGGAAMFAQDATSSTEDGSFRQYWALTDANGIIVVSDDAFGGRGLARPWISVPMQPRFSMDAQQQWDYMTISNGFTHTEKKIWGGRIPLVSHPRLEYHVLYGTASGPSVSATYSMYVDNEATPRDTWSASSFVSQIRTMTIKDLIDRTWVDVKWTVTAAGTGSQLAAQLESMTLRQS